MVSSRIRCPCAIHELESSYNNGDQPRVPGQYSGTVSIGHRISNLESGLPSRTKAASLQQDHGASLHHCAISDASLRHPNSLKGSRNSLESRSKSSWDPQMQGRASCLYKVSQQPSRTFFGVRSRSILVDQQDTSQLQADGIRLLHANHAGDICSSAASKQ